MKIHTFIYLLYDSYIYTHSISIIQYTLLDVVCIIINLKKIKDLFLKYIILFNTHVN